MDGRIAQTYDPEKSGPTKPTPGIFRDGLNGDEYESPNIFTRTMAGDGVSCAVVSAAIASGSGDTHAGEYEPMREPHFAAAFQANFLKDEDRILGVSENGDSKAYRTDIIAWHHIIHDQLGKMPILATW